MSWWSNWFRRKKPQTPPVLPPPETLAMHVVVRTTAGELSGSVISGVMSQEPAWEAEGAPLTFYMLEFVSPAGVKYGDTVHLLVHATGWADYEADVEFAPDFNIIVRPVVAPKPNRTGVVILAGKSVKDDGGLFNPLGDTLLYALGHWHRGGQLRELAQENITYISTYLHDFFRGLGEVEWQNDQDINPQWPEYEADLAGLVDWAYDTRGVRMKVTVTGGGSNWRLASQKIERVIAAGRHHKIQMIEAVNEDNQSAAAAIEIVGLLRGLNIPISIGRGTDRSGLKADGDIAKATVDILHTERGYGPEDEPGGKHARQVRQVRDFYQFRRVAEDGEGPGPASSGQQLDDPYMIATKRAAGIVQGAEMFCVHTGAGVFGRNAQTPYGFRPARLADVPQMDAIMRATRNADLHIPKGCGNWEKFNSNQPIGHIAGNANKLFGCKSGNQVVEVLIGCDGVQTFQATSPATVDVYNIATGDSIGHHELAAVQPFQHEGLWAYLLIGETR